MLTAVVGQQTLGPAAAEDTSKSASSLLYCTSCMTRSSVITSAQRSGGTHAIFCNIGTMKSSVAALEKSTYHSTDFAVPPLPVRSVQAALLLPSF
jgi:hypothetical protein